MNLSSDAAQGRALVSALAKLAVPESTVFLRATASSHLSDRLARLAGPPQVPQPRSKPATGIAICCRDHGLRLSNNRTYRLLFPPQAITTAYFSPRIVGSN